MSRSAAPNTLLEHRSQLDVYTESHLHRKTGIICTIGPKTASVEMITKLRLAGMNIARMNFSHGSHQYHGGVVAAVRQSVIESPMGGQPIAIALDTKGPEIRTGLTKTGEDVMLTAGRTVTVTTDPSFAEGTTETVIYVDYKNLPNVLSAGDTIFIDDGLLSLKVKKTGTVDLTAEVINSGALGSRKGVNLPKVDVDLPALSEKDISDLKFGVEQGVDMVFASFIRKREDVIAVRECLGEEGKHIKIISKIENHEGVRNFDEILEETDGVMVARDDLGIEVVPEKVFLAQKMMIAKCNLEGKPVICATQMLESMTNNPRPTRAEASDVANAVLDGADVVMLSGETAKGKYPIETVLMMGKICREAERIFHHEQALQDFMDTLPPVLPRPESVALSASLTTLHQDCAAIVTLTNTGESVRLIAKFRPACPIILVSRKAHICRQSHLHRGCYPFEYPEKEMVKPRSKDIENRVAWALSKGVEHSLVKPGDTVVVVHGGMYNGRSVSLSDFHLRVVPTQE